MPANTTRGYPYPLPTEPVAEGAQAIRNLAEAIEVRGMQLIGDVIAPAGGQAILEFLAIPASFNHLHLRVTARCHTAAAALLGLQFNSDAASNYDWQRFGAVGTGLSAVSFTGAGGINFGDIPNTTSGANRFAYADIDINDYRNAQHKVASGKVVNPYTSPAVPIAIGAGVWKNVAAITSLRLVTFSDAFAAGSRATLYGLQ